MGRDKSLLTLHGETLLARAVRVLAECCGAGVKVVTSPELRAAHTSAAAGAGMLCDLIPGRGALGGIHTALSDCAVEFAVILAVDLPLVEGRAIRQLMLASRSTDADVVVPRQPDGRLQPLFSAFRATRCLPGAAGLLAEPGYASVRDLLAVLATVVVDGTRIDAEPNLLLNVNDPAAFELAARLG
jgi:molybdopterin-guanine dinucleotide biosynthesis protein A